MKRKNSIEERHARWQRLIRGEQVDIPPAEQELQLNVTQRGYNLLRSSPDVSKLVVVWKTFTPRYPESRDF